VLNEACTAQDFWCYMSCHTRPKQTYSSIPGLVAQSALLSRLRPVGLKLTNRDKHTADDEQEPEAHIARTDQSHHGRPLFRTFSKCFDVSDPGGKHPCLAYEPVREPLWLCQKHSKDGRILLPITKDVYMCSSCGSRLSSSS
jgi:hypothetical protein